MSAVIPSDTHAAGDAGHTIDHDNIADCLSALSGTAPGGTVTPAAAFNAGSPMTTPGDMAYESGPGGAARLPGSTSGTKNFLTQTGTGSASAAPAWGTIAPGDLPAASTSAQGALQLDGSAGDMQASPAAAAAGASGQAADAKHVHPPPAALAPAGLTGATAATRFAGGTVSGAPASGTFAAGDFVIDQTAKVWVCTTAGSPGTWTQAGGGGGGMSNPMTAAGDIIDGGSGGTPGRLGGNTTATKNFLTSTGTGSAATSPAWGTVAAGDIPTLNQSTTGTAANITGTLDAVPAPAANVGMNSKKITGLASGTAGTDAATVGQILPLAGGTMAGWLASTLVALTYGTTISLNAALGNVFAVTLTASTGTIANPANPVDTQVIRIRVIQDGTGSRTVSWGTAYDWGTGGSAPALSAGAGKMDILGFEYVASLSKWVYLSAPFPQGF